jgi:2-dehydro-3-deoxyglucarate aldolase
MNIDVTAVFHRRLRGRELLFAGWTSIGHPQITEALTKSNVDFIGIDIEHSTISLGESLAIIAASQAAGIACLPRVASHNPEMIKRLLDSGADGILVPMVSTPAEAESIVGWCKYPPQGKRSFGVARAHGYGIEFAEYTRRWNEASSILVQIETIQGVENIEKILNYDEIDGVMIGPYDLSASLGIPGQIDSPQVREATKHVNAVCRRLGRACGTQQVDPTTESMVQAVQDGCTFVVLASDVFLLAQWSRTMRRQIEETRSRSS